MGIVRPFKTVLAGKPETYDITADPQERRDLGGGANLPAALSTAVDGYPIPSTDAARAPQNLDDDARRRLASLGT